MSSKKEKSFNLLRWFSILSFLCIGLITVVSAYLLSRFLSHNMLMRDAVVTMEFVQSIAQTQNTPAYFEEGDQGKSKAAFEDFLKRIVVMPEVVRVNVYAMDRTILWSDQQNLIGHSFSVNPDLEKALSGRLAVTTGTSGKPKKGEHVFDKDVAYFAEMYIPIWNHTKGRVVGAVEVYKVPIALLHAIENGNRLVWISTLGGGLFLYGSLFWIVRRANVVIRRQQERLVESETMAAVGEMASAVAHGIRNPLASIRSSAEVALEEKSLSVFRQAAEDIVAEADRLEKWIRDLITYSRPLSNTLTPTQINEVIRESLSGFEKEMEKRGIKLTLDLEEPLSLIQADAARLGQVFNNLIANALEAMPNGGILRITNQISNDRSRIQIKFIDTGQGIPKDQIEKVFKPFFTTKQKGLGVGLSLTRRIVERHNGTIEISSQEGQGTSVLIQIPIRG